MKRLIVMSGAIALLTLSCAKSDGKRMDALEERLKKLEERPSMPSRPTPPSQDKAYNIPVGTSPVLGNKDAKIDVVVFSDYQCPFCAKADTLVQDLVKDPELKSKIKVVYKFFPLSFHPNAKPAAKAALAAAEQGADKFWKFSTKGYENQQALTDENFTKWCKEIGCDVTKFKADLKKNDAKYEEIIKQDMELGIKEAKVRGTPSIYVAGWEFMDERSVEGMKRFIKSKNLE